MTIRLLHYRVASEIPVAQAAQISGVDEETYRSWERGQTDAPKAKLKKLASAFGTDVSRLTDSHPPISTRIYDQSAGADLEYWGEVAFHFIGGGKPLLLPLSTEAYEHLYVSLQTEDFVSVESLSNQTVILRRSALSDTYFSSEAYGDVGPEPMDYSQILLPDGRDWRIIESMEMADSDEDDPQVVRMAKWLDSLDDEDREIAFERASRVIYQLSNGVNRSVYVKDTESLYDAFDTPVEYPEQIEPEKAFRFDVMGAHRTIFARWNALDYVSIPTHMLEAGRDYVLAEEVG